MAQQCSQFQEHQAKHRGSCLGDPKLCILQHALLGRFRISFVFAEISALQKIHIRIGIRTVRLQVEPDIDVITRNGRRYLFQLLRGVGPPEPIAACIGKSKHKSHEHPFFPVLSELFPFQKKSPPQDQRNDRDHCDRTRGLNESHDHTADESSNNKLYKRFAFFF